jgi:hypothetical protein
MIDARMRRWSAALLALASSSALLSAACSDVTLERLPDPPPPPIDNLMAVRGKFCTEKPESVEFPVKVLFVVDVSDSMSVTDPPDPADNNYTARTRAVIDVVNALAGVPGVEIAIIAFQSGINDLTGGFKPNFTAPEVAFLIDQAQRLNSERGQTNYDGALEAAFQLLVADVQAADDLTRSRSKYTVIFVSDGYPEPIDPPANTPESILDTVASVRRLERERRLVELKLHTVYLSGRTPPQFQQGPIDLLRDMARAGGGTFRNIGNGEKINFLDIGFTAFRRVFNLKSFLVENRNARPRVALEAATDSDGDGLSDDEEVVIGTSVTSTDTDLDGFSDRLENGLRNAGLDPLDGNDADCRTTPTDGYNRRDDDGDGLLNCEERFLGTNPRLIDTDADGIPDPIEARARTSPVTDDRFQDPDRDKTVNLFEVRDHTDPALDDRPDYAKLRYEYDVRQVEIRDSQLCFTFRVDNVQLVSSAGVTPADEGWNLITMVVGQAPGDDPDDFGEFRMACARARFRLGLDLKSPAAGLITVPEAAFKKPANPRNPNDPDVLRVPQDCVSPTNEVTE